MQENVGSPTIPFINSSIYSYIVRSLKLPSIDLLNYPTMHLIIHRPIRPSVHPLISPSICLVHPIRPSISHPSIHPSFLAFIHHRESEIQLRGKSVRSWCDGSLDRSFMVDPLSYFSLKPVLHDWCYPVCGMVHIKEPCS